MASLQTLRDRGGVIVAIVIGLALVAFLLGDLLGSGGTLLSDNNAGEIDGKSISITEYTAKVDQLNVVAKFTQGEQPSTDEQIAQIQAQAWESFIREIALMPQLEELGIKTTNKMTSELFAGKYPSQMLMTMFADPQTGAFSQEYLRGFAANVDQDPTGELAMFWNYRENEVKDQESVENLRALTDAAAFTTNLEATFVANLQATNSSIAYSSTPYASIADSTVNVTDSQIKQYFNENKNLFKGQPSRAISYVTFEALPSEQDYMEAEKQANILAEELAAAADVAGYARANTQGDPTEKYFAEDQLSGELAEYAFGSTDANIYGPVLNGTEYMIAKIADKGMIRDSVELNQIVIEPNKSKLADSIASALRKGADFKTLVAKYSLDQQTPAGKIGTVDPQMLPAQFSAELVTASANDVIVVALPQQIHIMKVGKVYGNKTKVKLATINFTIEPSSTTRNMTYAKATEFVIDARDKNIGYSKSVSDSALIARSATIYPNQRSVQGLNDSRELTSWTYNGANENTVSDVMSFGDSFVVAALTAINEENFLPIESVTEQIRMQLVRNEKIDVIIKQIEQNAPAKNLTANNVTFDSYIVGDAGYEPALAGAVAVLKQGENSKPITGFQGVFTADVTSQTTNQTDPLIEKERIEAQRVQMAFMLLYQGFVDKTEIEDTRYKFY